LLLITQKEKIMKKLAISIAMSQEKWDLLCFFLSKIPFSNNDLSKFKKAAEMAALITDAEGELTSLEIDTDKIGDPKRFLEALGKAIILASQTEEDLTTLVTSC